MNSMTGVGSICVENANFKLEINIKSTNSRFLDTKFYIPNYYLSLESELKKKIAQKCKRGHFLVSINRFPYKPSPSISLHWNKNQAKKWKTLYQDISNTLKIENQWGLKELIQQEGVLNLIEKPQTLSQREKTIVKKTFNKALHACLQERKREGFQLKKDILSQFKSIQTFINQIEILNQKSKENFLIKHKKTKAKFLDSEEKFVDLHEEIIRVKEHLNHLKIILNKTKEVGRKVDFYIPEILREVNTIGAKTVLTQINLKVVDIKCFLERAKEQIQNVE
ncbi:MAG: DUF1732 domain-containing protein [Bdellovibrionales bacterium]|nr:DUF1732 domain-containing protein [Bdellovibrionales bacterium]